MMQFIGTKMIRAITMNRGDYNSYRGWTVPSDEQAADPGYLVEYMDGGKSNHTNHIGYISWSPAEQFEKAYRPTSGMTFGLALEALKLGHRVARAGWNGKGMWLSLSGHLDGRIVEASGFWSMHNADFARENGGKAKVQPCITMKTAANEIQMGWLASQSDMLANDWIIT
jgi:hypothetical protein